MKKLLAGCKALIIFWENANFAIFSYVIPTKIRQLSTDLLADAIVGSAKSIYLLAHCNFLK